MNSIYKYLIFLTFLLYSWVAKAQMDAPINFPLPASIQSQPIIDGDFFWDIDPGLGAGQNIALTSGADVQLSNFQVGISDLTSGVHHLYLRVKNAHGIWGMTQMHNFYLVPAMAILPPGKNVNDITAAEYFIDDDPGLGAGISITLSSGADVEMGDVAVDISSLDKGVHHLYFRVKNNAGAWSQTNMAVLYVLQQEAVIPPSANLTDIVQGEYFIDTDPGLGSGNVISFSSSEDVHIPQVVVDISGLAPGVHYIYTRFKNVEDRWSLNNVSSFIVMALDYTIPAHGSVGMMTAIEYFFDEDPGFGNGTMLSITPTADLVNFEFSADLNGLKMDTIHTLYVRALDGWSMTSAATFELGHALPVTWLSFTGKLQSGGAVLLEWKTAMEQEVASYVVEKSLDGVHFTAIHSMAAGGIVDQDGNHNYRYTDLHASGLNLTYRIKQMDKDGKSSYSSVLTLHNLKQDGAGFYVINNPVQHSLKVHLGAGRQQGYLQVFDMNGRQLLRQEVNQQAVQQLDVSKLSAGTYIVRYVSAQVQESRKFIKR